MELEKKLAEFRAKKERETRINNMKLNIKQFFTARPKEENCKSEYEETQKEPLVAFADSVEVLPDDSASSIISTDDESLLCCSYTDLLFYCLWFALWCILYMIFIELQFGTVFLISSAIVFMYINTRTGPKKPNEVSAYSVFNKDCESIDGTLKAEQFEREIRYGSASVR